MELEPGKIYHIYNRGNNRENIFREERNYPYFLSLWKHHVHPIAETFAYSLLPNHFHMVVRIRYEKLNNGHTIHTDEKKISQHLSNFFNAYAKSINKAYERRGSLFQERFGRKEVATGSYCAQLVCYVHTNAQKHGILADFHSHRHNSYSSVLSDMPTLLQRNEVLEWFGGKTRFVDAHRAYVHDKDWNTQLLELPNDDDD